MKLVTNKETTIKLLAEILSEYQILAEENPFAAAAEEGGDKKDDAADAGGEEDAGEEGGEEKESEKKDKAPEPKGITIKFNVDAVKRYNDAAFRSDGGEVKAITKNGLQVAVDNNETIHVNFQDIAETRLVRNNKTKLLKEDSMATSDSTVEALLVQISKELKSMGAVPVAPAKVSLAAMKSDDVENALVGKTEKEDELLKEMKKSGGSKRHIKESLGLTLFLAAPTLIKLLGKIVSKAEKDTKVGQGIEKVGKGLHTIYTAPLRGLIAGLFWMYVPSWNYTYRKAWKDAEKTTDMIFALVMLAVAGQGAVESISHLTKSVAVASFVTAVVDTYKIADSSGKVIKSAKKPNELISDALRDPKIVDFMLPKDLKSAASA